MQAVFVGSGLLHLLWCADRKLFNTEPHTWMTGGKERERERERGGGGREREPE